MPSTHISLRARLLVFVQASLLGFLGFVGFVGLTVLPGRALGASGGGDDEVAIRRALDLRREGKDREALEEFQKLYEIGRSARVLAQMGMAEQALGRWVDAETHLEQALLDGGHPWIRKNALALRSALGEIQRHLGSLDVIGPRGAEVRVDGQLAGSLPFSKPVRVPIGVLNIVISMNGYLPSTRSVSVGAGVLTRETVNLQKVETVSRGLERTPGDRGTEAIVTAPSPSSPDESQHVETPAAAEPERTWQRPLAWGTAGGAVAGVVGGSVALLLRNQKVNDANDLKCNVGSGTVTPVDPTNTDRCISLANTASQLATGAIVALSIGAALAIGSAVLFATMPEAPPASNVACAPSWPARGQGIVCQFRF